MNSLVDELVITLIIKIDIIMMYVFNYFIKS